MEKVVNILLQELAKKQIKRHIICPSASVTMKDFPCIITNGLEIIDERSAGYVATGMCAEANEPVVVWCANNVSFRNLTSALTEAYYRKLPLLIVALPCVDTIDQTMNPEDILRYKYRIPQVVTTEQCETILSDAVESLFSEVAGPCLLLIENNISFVPKYDSVAEVVRPKDGGLSKLIGASVVEPKRLFVGEFISAELAYDINMFGNRHVGNNLVVVNTDSVEEDHAIFDFAKRMNWDCKRMSNKQYADVRRNLTMANQPQYIEIVK